MQPKTKIKLKVSCGIIAIVFSVCASILLSSHRANAAPSDSDIMKRALAGAMLMCYRNYTVNFDTPFETDKVFFVENAVYPNGNYVMPTNVGNKLNNRTVNCREVFTGVDGAGLFDPDMMKGIIEEFGKNESSVTLANLGYVAGTGVVKSSKKCIHLNYKIYNSGSTYDDGGNPDGYQTNDLCFPIDSDGKVDVSNPDNITQEGTIEPERYKVSLYYSPYNSCVAGEVSDGSGGTLSQDTSCVAWPLSCDSGQCTFNEVLEQAKEYAENITVKYSVVTKLGYDPFGEDRSTNFKVGSSEGGSLTETVELNSNSAVVAMNWLSGQTNGFTDFTFGPNEWAYLYNQYIEQLKSDGEIAISTSCTASKTDANVITMDNGNTWCKVDRAENVARQFAGQDGNSNKLLKLMSFTEILEKLKKLDYSRVDAGLIGSNPNDNSGTTAGEAGTIAPCYEGAGVLGWIVCPVMEAVGLATAFLYDSFIEPALKIPATALFGQSSDSGIYGAWSTFRNFANIIFVIAFVIIILSQVTGIGVSNYGIKKMLPRLVMVVILVNISFIICQLLVDVSNIIGSSISDTFGSIKINGSEQNSLGDIMLSVLNAALLTTTVGFGTFTILSLPVVAAGIQYLAIPIVLALIGCLISVIFFFILLAVRQAGVIILVVLSPLAVVCYALPNTKNLFDRWKKLFTAMLFVYPICGLVMSGGKFVGALMLSMVGNDNQLGAFYTIAAMLVNVVPFFFVPSLLKGSMALAGNLGAKLSNFGAGIRGGINRSIRNSEAYKLHQQEAGRVLGLRKNQTRVGRYSKTGGGGVIGNIRRSMGLNDNLSERQQTLAAQAQSSIDKSVGDVGAALRLGWENDGSADNLDKGSDSIMQRYLTATRALQNDPNDYGALERQRAAASILLGSGKGRSILFAANRTLTDEMVSASGEDQEKARQVLRRTANNLMRTNGADIGKSALLSSQFKMFKDSTVKAGDLEDRILEDSIGGLSTQDMASMSKSDLKYYNDAILNDKIKHGSDEFRRLTSVAARAMSDPHYKGRIEEDSMGEMKALANMRYAQSKGADVGSTEYQDSVTRAIGRASNEELARIRSDLSTGSVSSEQRAQMLQNLSNTLIRGAQDSNFKIESSTASQIDDILRENNIDVVAAGAAAGVSDMQGALDAMTGLKIQHAPRQTLKDQHSTWRRATADDVRAAVGNRGSHARVPFAADDWVKEEGGKLVKLSGAEAAEANLLEKADAEALIAERQAAFQEQQRRQARQQQTNGNSPNP